MKTVASRKRLGAPPLLAVLALLVSVCFSPAALAQDPACPTDLPNPVYGAGGSAVTATLGNVALALAGLDEPITIFYNDPGACTGYRSLTEVGLVGRPVPAYFKYWTVATGATANRCTASGTEVLSFAHMGNTPLLCPANAPLPAGFGDFTAPVQTINFITDFASQEDSISAEALYHIYGFGPGASDSGAVDRSVAPWTVPLGVFARKTDSFVHLITAGAIGVPATGFKVPQDLQADPVINNFLNDNPTTVARVGAWANPDESLGFVSGSAADLGQSAGTIKTLAYQHYGQTAAYLPDSGPGELDKANVRSGQYYLWTPGHFFSAVDGEGVPTNPVVRDLIGWFQGKIEPPEDVNVLDIIIDSGDVPLCAMQAIRAAGDLTAITSYAPTQPCNGYFEVLATGTTEYAVCDGDDECDEEAEEKCRFGYCEAY